METNLIKISRFNNVSKFGIDEKSYKELFKKPELKRLVEQSMLGCELFGSIEERNKKFHKDDINYYTIDLENICGRLLKVEDDYIGIMLANSPVGNMLYEMLQREPQCLKAYPRIIGVKNEETGLLDAKKFICFDIILCRG